MIFIIICFILLLLLFMWALMAENKKTKIKLEEVQEDLKKLTNRIEKLEK